MTLRVSRLSIGVLLLVPIGARAWDYHGHRIVNQVALAALPKDFPAFVRKPANLERIAFLAGEPDRWRNLPSDQPLSHASGMDHYFDVEFPMLAGLNVAKLPDRRYEFAALYAAGRTANLAKFPAIDERFNTARTREWCGFLPWAIAESYERLRAAFSYLKTLEELGTPEEIANAQANVIYYMGILGHFAGDAAQPLHTTHHDHGWVGPNPKGYTTWPGIHSWIDSGLIDKAGIKFADVAPRVVPAAVIPTLAREDGREPVFVAAVDFIVAQNQLVEPLYQLEKARQLGSRPEETPSAEARAFVEKQLLAGGEELAALWLTAWNNVVPDTFLRNSLLKRAGAEPAKGPADDRGARKPRAKKTTP